MAIYDCFQYFNEDHIVDLRLNILDQYVDYFVISESNRTHQGEEKKINFDIKKFSKFKDKISYIVVDKEPPDINKVTNSDTEKKKEEKLILNGMARDNFQRENLQRGLINAEDNDFILVSDLDEIPKLNNVKLSGFKDKIILFEQDMFYYKFNLIYKNFKWFGTKGVKKKLFISPQWLRNIKNKVYQWWRVDTLFSKKKYSNISIIKNGGWHFTCIKTPEELEKKMLNFAHHYEFEESGLGLEDLRKLIDNKKVMYQHNIDKKGIRWGEGSKLEKVDISFLPEYINLNSKNYERWLD